MSTAFHIFNINPSDTLLTIESIQAQGVADTIVVYEPSSLPQSLRLKSEQITTFGNVTIRTTEACMFCSKTLEYINSLDHEYNFIYTKTSPLSLGYRAMERMVQACESVHDAMAYADYYELKPSDASPTPHPLIDSQPGSIRNDFDYGSLRVYHGKFHVGEVLTHAALYADHLRRPKIHIPEFLYTEMESDLRQSGQKQFDYVNPSMRSVQIEMENVCTKWLDEQKVLINPSMLRRANLDVEFALEASVVIPVRNRDKTIADAIRSALDQQTTFTYNVIVVNNHSTDFTAKQIDNIANEDSRVVHLIPKRHDLGIGGCWDFAIRSEHCGKFAVQLDSDDLYSSPHTLQRVVDKFYETHAAMVIGSYSLVDFNLNPLPPGLIDHREWTDENGPNNALRINGLGAPRAFFVPVLRQIGFPNTSYGEDYAVGLAISRSYRIGRIYDNLYLCRRWQGNSDAALSIAQTNRNNYYKDWIRTQELYHRTDLRAKCVDEKKLTDFFETQLERWHDVRKRFAMLDNGVERANFFDNDTSQRPIFTAQHNPSRIVSTGAKLDVQTIAKRKCFLCQDNQPAEQLHLPYHHTLQFCVNPFPILHHHFTIPLMAHEPQVMAGHYEQLADISSRLKHFVVFYNGAQCGASAPDHFHFQAGALNEIPLQRDIDYYLQSAKHLCNTIFYCTGFAYPFFFTTDHSEVERIVRALPTVEDEPEPRFNLIAWSKGVIIIPRRKLRPFCYYADGDANMCISPGAVDMGGLIITPHKKDFLRLNTKTITSILQEVALSTEELQPTINKLSKASSDD